VCHAGVRHPVLDRGRGRVGIPVLKELAYDCLSQPAPSQGFHPGAMMGWSYRRNQLGRWSGQKSHHGLHCHCCSYRCCCRHYRYCGFCYCTCSGCHWCHHFRHWVGETAWKMVAWPQGMQQWCRAPSRQSEAWYCPCESPPVADHPKL
jgi:hypothetical protein